MNTAHSYKTRNTILLSKQQHLQLYKSEPKYARLNIYKIFSKSEIWVQQINVKLD